VIAIIQSPFQFSQRGGQHIHEGVLANGELVEVKLGGPDLAVQVSDVVDDNLLLICQLVLCVFDVVNDDCLFLGHNDLLSGLGLRFTAPVAGFTLANADACFFNGTIMRPH
jgi:hypothetical protein